ncbi:MAG TPA: hypothetical protein VN256_03800 [Pyrinomonadaceae bacterium]|nr:hypothetical protein [Pyrinomonadaceae bacterium]
MALDEQDFINSHDLTIRMSREVGHRHPESFSLFFANWLTFLQSFVFPKYVTHFNPRRVNESATLRQFSQDNEELFNRLDKSLIHQLAQQRFIRTHVLGNTQIGDVEFVDDRVRWATDYLRYLLDINPTTVVGLNEENSGETGQNVDLNQNSYFINQQPLTALIVLLYQIRCNLFHGVKGYRNRSKRDAILTSIGASILRNILEEMGQ